MNATASLGSEQLVRTALSMSARRIVSVLAHGELKEQQAFALLQCVSILRLELHALRT